MINKCPQCKGRFPCSNGWFNPFVRINIPCSYCHVLLRHKRQYHIGRICLSLMLIITATINNYIFESSIHMIFVLYIFIFMMTALQLPNPFEIAKAKIETPNE